MKKTVFVITLCLAAVALLAPGCSKPKKAGPSANNNGAGGSSVNGGSAANGATDLKLKWQTGKRYDMEMDLNQSSDTDIPDRPATRTDIKLTQGMHYSLLKNLPNGGIQLEVEFDRQNFSLSQGDKEIINYDSTQKTPIDPNSPAAPVGKAMQAMLDVPLDYTIAADGTVQTIDGTNELMDRIKSAVPNARTRMSLDQLYDHDTLKRYCDFAQSLPDHPVSPGDSWTSSQDINNPVGVITVDATYTLKNFEQHNGHNCAHIAITGDIKTKSTSAANVGAVVTVKKGTITGEAWFDADLGMFVDIKSDQDITLDIKTRNMALTQHMKQNVDMSLVDVN